MRVRLRRLWRPLAPATAGFNLGSATGALAGAQVSWWSWATGAVLAAVVVAGYVADR